MFSMRKDRTILARIMMIALIGCFAGCNAMLKNMGSFVPSAVATDNFEKFVVHNDYNYFLSGSDVYPVAIFGLKKDYVIASDDDLWKKIDQPQVSIPELVSNMQMRLVDCCLESAHGFDMLDHHGSKIGEWYSMLGLIIGIQMKDEKKVVIYPPLDTDDVKRYQGRSNGRGR